MPSPSPVRRHLSVVTTSPTSLPKYLFKRGNTFYFKRKIPTDVADGFPGFREQVWRSLGTCLLAKARVLLSVEVAEFDLRVAEMRRGQAVSRATVCVAEHAGPVAAPPSGVSVLGANQAGAAASSCAVEREIAAPRTLASSSEDSPQPTSSRTARPAKTVPIMLPAAPATAQAKETGPNRPSMLHLFEDWKQKQTRPRTVNSVHTAVMEFRTLYGALAVEDLVKAHARAYRDYLIERRLSKGTVENRLGFLSTLVRHGMKEMVEHLSVNPFERIEVTGAQGLRKPKDRRAYEVSELNTLFASRLYTRDYRPDGQAVDAAYWAPLMGPFLGARIEEVCQLRVEDVQRVNGVWCVRICDLGEDQKLKTPGSFRRVPLHEVIIKCGFLVYAAKMAKAGHVQLFPTLTNENANGIYSNAVGKWYGRYLESIGLSDHRLDYHSFRYCFRQQASLCGVENEVRDALTGHWLSNNDSGRAYMKAENRQYPFPKLVAAMLQLRYDELRIAHLFVDDPMAGVAQNLAP